MATGSKKHIKYFNITDVSEKMIFDETLFKLMSIKSYDGPDIEDVIVLKKNMTKEQLKRLKVFPYKKNNLPKDTVIIKLCYPQYDDSRHSFIITKKELIKLIKSYRKEILKQSDSLLKKFIRFLNEE